MGFLWHQVNLIACEDFVSVLKRYNETNWFTQDALAYVPCDTVSHTQFDRATYEHNMNSLYLPQQYHAILCQMPRSLKIAPVHQMHKHIHKPNSNISYLQKIALYPGSRIVHSLPHSFANIKNKKKIQSIDKEMLTDTLLWLHWWILHVRKWLITQYIKYLFWILIILYIMGILYILYVLDLFHVCHFGKIWMHAKYTYVYVLHTCTYVRIYVCLWMIVFMIYMSV